MRRGSLAAPTARWLSRTMVGLVMALGTFGWASYTANTVWARAALEGARMANANMDVAKIAQLVLDLNTLQKYYHPELPGRKPLRMLKSGPMQNEPRLVMFGQPVEYVPVGSPTPHFEFTRIDVTGDGAVVEFSYPVEGLRGTANLRKAGGSWQIEKSSVRER